MVAEPVEGASGPEGLRERTRNGEGPCEACRLVMIEGLVPLRGVSE